MEDMNNCSFRFKNIVASLFYFPTKFSWDSIGYVMVVAKFSLILWKRTLIYLSLSGFDAIIMRLSDFLRTNQRNIYNSNHSLDPTLVY